MVLSRAMPLLFAAAPWRLPTTPLMMADAPLYCLNVQLCVKPERREEFMKTIAANQRGTLGVEPLAVSGLERQLKKRARPAPRLRRACQSWHACDGFFSCGSVSSIAVLDQAVIFSRYFRYWSVEFIST